MKRTLLIAAVAFCAAGSVQADVIERACLSSDRQQANRSLCGCIQSVADITLTRRDQRMAASFFKDPHRAQEVRQSGRTRDERFWVKYRAFGQTAENYCN